MKKSSLCSAALALSLVAALSGCKKSNSDSEASVAINANCPIMTQNAVSTKANTVQYNGVTIGFCCNDCVDDWNSWTDEKKAQFVKDNTPDILNKYGNPPVESDH